MVKFWKNRKILLFLPIFAVLTSFFLANVNWREISDERKAQSFRPSDEIASIASDLKLTQKGKTIFYATAPQLQTAKQIKTHCGNNSDQRYLGCYYPGSDERIYLQNINMDAIDEYGLSYNFRASRNETALHELLHAVYDRLASSERNKICENIHVDSKLAKKLSSYSNDQYCTEAFARIGSESIELADDNLRAIYSNYFEIDDAFYATNAQNNRNLASYSASINNLSSELKAKKQTIDQMRSDYSVKPTWQKMNNANATIDEYNLLLKEYHQKLETYNKIVAAI